MSFKSCSLWLAIFIVQQSTVWAFDISSLWKSNPFKIEGHENYSFKSCQQFNQKDPQDYVVCRDSNDQLQMKELDDLSHQMQKIEAHVLEDDYLARLKQSATKELLAKQNQMQALGSCLSNPYPDQACVELKAGYISRIRQELPQLRTLMAQMEMPGKIYSAKEPDRFDHHPKHSRGETKVPVLSSSEVKFLRQHTKELEASFRIDVTSEVEMLKECQDKRPCPGKEPIIDSYISQKFTEQNKRYKEAYQDLVSANPLLSLLPLSGEESDQVILENVNKQLSFLIEKSQQSQQYIKKLQGEDRKELLGLGLSVNNFLGENPDQIQCDISQKLLNDFEWDETKKDLFLVAGTVVGAGACAFTAGIGCAVGVASEGINLALVESKHRKENHFYYAGQLNVSNLESVESERNLTLFLAPLSLVTFGTAKSISGLKSMEKVGAKAAAKEKRTDFSQRKTVDKLLYLLGQRREKYLQIYNPKNKYQLTELDQTYLAGIAEILEEKVLKKGGKISSTQLRKEVQTELDEIMRTCHGKK